MSVSVSFAPSYLRKAIRDVPRSLLALTLGRLLLIPVVILSFGTSPPITTAALALFVLADLYDGVAARRLGADNPARRVLDSLVDRVAIWAVFAALTIAGFLPPVLFAALVARDLYCGHLCQKIVASRNIVLKADWLYRLLNLMLATWVAIAPLLGSGVRAGAFVAVLAVSALVALDLRRSVAAILAMPPSIVSMVLPAGDVRRLSRSPQGQGSAASRGAISPIPHSA